MSALKARADMRRGSKYIIPILLFGLAIRLSFIFIAEPDITENSDPSYYHRIALGILDGEGYHEENLYSYRPPLFPYFIAGIYWLFGVEITAVRVIQAFIGALIVFIIYLIGKSVGNREIGYLAASFAAIYPQLFRYSVEYYTETLFILFTMMAILAVLRSATAKGLFWKATAGVMIGLSILTKEVGWFTGGAILIWYLYLEGNIVRGAKKWAIIILFACLTIAPWTVRNYAVFNSFVPVSTYGGINFYMGNNPEANGGFKWRIAPGAIWNKPSPSGTYELEASRLGYREGIKFIVNNPGRFCELVGRRIYLLWRPPYANMPVNGLTKELIYKAGWVFLYCLAFAGGLVIGPFVLRKEFRKWSLFYIMFFLLSLPYFVTYAGWSRYHAPLVPFMIILSSAAFWRIRRGEYH